MAFLNALFQINGITKQNSATADMIFRIPRLIEHISSIMTLEAGSFTALVTDTDESSGG